MQLGVQLFNLFAERKSIDLLLDAYFFFLSLSMFFIYITHEWSCLAKKWGFFGASAFAAGVVHFWSLFYFFSH